MKTKLIRLGCGLLIAALLAAAAGCGAGNGSEPSETTTAAPTETTTVVPTETTTAAPTETTAPAEKTGEWVAAYRAYLLNVLKDMPDDDSGMADEFRFGFFYLDNDSVPEVWYIYAIGAHGPGYVILTCRDGKVVEVTDGANFLSYYEKKGVFSFSGITGAFGSFTGYYKMTDSGSETLDEAEYAIDIETEKGSYLINGAEVSEKEFNALPGQYVSRYGSVTEIGEKDGFPFKEESVRKNCQ